MEAQLHPVLLSALDGFVICQPHALPLNPPEKTPLPPPTPFEEGVVWTPEPVWTFLGELSLSSMPSSELRIVQCKIILKVY